MTKSAARLTGLAAAIMLATVAGSASAGGNEAAAEALFVEAKKLVAKGRFAEACPKFAESNRLDRGAGTLIHLADCYEKNKQTATAWATYKEAASAAQALGRSDWQKKAEKRATALEPKLAHLTIKVQFPVDKLEVTKDGAAMSSASWDVPLPVDVGTHAIEASAPGFKPYKTSARVAKDSENIEVAVPKLEEEPKPEPAAAAPAVTPTPATQPAADATGATTNPPPAADTGSGSGLKTVGWIAVGAGVVGIGVGAVTGLMAVGKNNDSKALCPDEGACRSRDGVDANESAQSLGTVSTIGFIGGGVLVAGGVLFILTAPKDRTTGMRVVPHAGPGGGGLLFSGAF
jgi:hypothetical protein